MALRDFEGERTDFGEELTQIGQSTSRKVNAIHPTDIGSGAGRTRLYCAMDEASVPVACMSGRGELSLAASIVVDAAGALSFAGSATWVR
jgi:hypothetical protein